MKYFTSDSHFCETRLKLFYRDIVAKDAEEFDNLIIRNWNKTIKKDDTVYHLGDVTTVKNGGLEKVKLLNGNKILIKGNYDQQFSNEELLEYFDEVVEEMNIKLKDISFYLNHYPTNCKADLPNITGHIHSLWKVQRNMINVGLDAWNLYPVSEENILFTYEAIKKYYDENVFAGELECNKKTDKKDNDNYQKNWIFDGEKSLNYNGHIINKIWNTIDNEYFLNISGDLDYNKFEANFSRTEKIETFSGNKKEIEDKFKIKIS